MASVDLLAWLRATDDDEDDRLADRLETQFENLPIQVVTEGGGHNHPEIEALISEDSGFTQAQADALYAPIDHMHPGGGSLPSIDWGVQYVHTAASDSNDGFSPYTPKATVEAAVGDLPDGGVVILSKGRHDVGEGLHLDKLAPVILRGVGRWHRHRSTSGQTTFPGNDPVLYSSIGASKLIDFPAAGDTQGFGFENLIFEMSATTDYGIYAQGVSYTNVVDCCFWSKNVLAEAIHADNLVGSDASWWRVINNNFVSSVAIYGGGNQFNNWVVRDNNSFVSNPAPFSMYFESMNRSLVAGNNIEGNLDVGIELGKVGTATAYDNIFIGNGGEGVKTVYHLVHTGANTIIATGEKAGGDTLIKDDSGGGNVIIAPGRRYPPDQNISYLDDLIIDNPNRNTIITNYSLKVHDEILYTATYS